MSNFREAKACIAYAYGSNFISEQEFVLLYDCQKSTNPEFLYWNCTTNRFDLDEKSNEECKAEFRFLREVIKFIERFFIQQFTFHSYRVVL